MCPSGNHHTGWAVTNSVQNSLCFKAKNTGRVWGCRRVRDQDWDILRYMLENDLEQEVKKLGILIFAQAVLGLM